MNEKRRSLAILLTQGLSEIQEITPPSEKPGNKHVYQMYTVRVNQNLDRDQFVRSLNGKGIGASVHFYPPVHHMAPYQGDNYRRDGLEITEKVIREIVTLPMYPSMMDDDIHYMVQSIKEVLFELQ